jgi:hypothetical protein
MAGVLVTREIVPHRKDGGAARAEVRTTERRQRDDPREEHTRAVNAPVACFSPEAKAV